MSLRSAFASMPTPVAAQSRKSAFTPVRPVQAVAPVEAPSVELLPGQHPRVSREIWERVHPGDRDRVNHRAAWHYRGGRDFDEAVLAAIAEIESERAVTGQQPVDVEPDIGAAAQPVPLKQHLPSAGLLDGVFR